MPLSIHKPNQWGIIREITDMQPISYPIVDEWGNKPLRYITYPSSIIKLSVDVPNTPEMWTYLHGKFFDNDSMLPFYSDEWMCLYCASPNPLPLTHCDKCGAPRNWILG